MGSQWKLPVRVCPEAGVSLIVHAFLEESIQVSSPRQEVQPVLPEGICSNH